MKRGFDDDGNTTVPVRHGTFKDTKRNNGIDAAKRWYQRINQKKQNFGTCLRENYIEVQSYKNISQNMVKSMH